MSWLRSSRACRRARLALLPLCLLTGTADETAAGDRRGVKDVTTFLELRQQKVVLQQYDISCGAAALATILRYQHGDQVTEKEVASSMLEHTDSELVRARLGFSLLDLKQYAERRGYLADGFGGLTLVDLIELGPSIVPVKINQVYDHFLVFRGLAGNRVVLSDPAYGNRTMTAREFMEIWPSRIAFAVRRADGTQGGPGELRVLESDLRVPSHQMIRSALP